MFFKHNAKEMHVQKNLISDSFRLFDTTPGRRGKSEYLCLISPQSEEASFVCRKFRLCLDRVSQSGPFHIYPDLISLIN